MDEALVAPMAPMAEGIVNAREAEVQSRAAHLCSQADAASRFLVRHLGKLMVGCGLAIVACAVALQLVFPASSMLEALPALGMVGITVAMTCAVVLIQRGAGAFVARVAKKQGPIRYSLRRDGLLIASSKDELTWKWAAIEALGFDSSHIFVYRDRHQSVIVPARFFATPEGFRLFREELVQRASGARVVELPEHASSQWGPVRLGLCGLGVFVGLGFVAATVVMHTFERDWASEPIAEPAAHQLALRPVGDRVIRQRDFLGLEHVIVGRVRQLGNASHRDAIDNWHGGHRHEDTADALRKLGANAYRVDSIDPAGEDRFAVTMQAALVYTDVVTVTDARFRDGRACLVTYVHDDSPADRTGVQVGDVLVGEDGAACDDILARGERLEPGESMQLDAIRASGAKHLRLVWPAGGTTLGFHLLDVPIASP